MSSASADRSLSARETLVSPSSFVIRDDFRIGRSIRTHTGGGSDEAREQRDHHHRCRTGHRRGLCASVHQGGRKGRGRRHQPGEGRGRGGGAARQGWRRDVRPGRRVQRGRHPEDGAGRGRQVGPNRHPDRQRRDLLRHRQREPLVRLPAEDLRRELLRRLAVGARRLSVHEEAGQGLDHHAELGRRLHAPVHARTTTSCRASTTASPRRRSARSRTSSPAPAASRACAATRSRPARR